MDLKHNALFLIHIVPVAQDQFSFLLIPGSNQDHVSHPNYLFLSQTFFHPSIPSKKMFSGNKYWGTDELHVYKLLFSIREKYPSLKWEGWAGPWSLGLFLSSMQACKPDAVPFPGQFSAPWSSGERRHTHLHLQVATHHKQLLSTGHVPSTHRGMSEICTQGLSWKTP